jgi:deazaflavin-dependent oxidoreductase (nitroreductase family)
VTTRDLQRRIARGFAKNVPNRLYRLAFQLGFAPPGTAILETTGRKTGQARQTPVTNGLDGDVFWIVVEHGLKTSYVRNIEHNPAVRILVGRQWRTGSAHVELGEDPLERLAKMRAARRAARRNTRLIKLVGTDLITVKVDLESIPAMSEARGWRQAKR